MKKIIITLACFFSFLAAEYRHPGENIALDAEKKINELLALPDIQERVAATSLGYGLSFASGAAGSKYIPTLGIIRVGKIAIPVKTIINILSSYVVGYSPLLTYLYIKSLEEQNNKEATSETQP
jgi:hypothetical protein